MQVPAFCDSCGAVFPSGIQMDNCLNTTFSACTAGPCPSCGSMGHIPDGVFNFVGDTIEVLSAPERSREDLTRLAAILRNAKVHGWAAAEVQQRIADEVPELSGLASLLPRTRTELYSFIALVLTVIAILQASNGSAGTTITTNQVISQTYVQNTTATVAAPEPAVPATRAAVQRSDVGRNDPCPCASGKKYKKCCGK